jgi:hypothetical protein
MHEAQIRPERRRVHLVSFEAGQLMAITNTAMAASRKPKLLARQKNSFDSGLTAH